jgi:hypothetical protein
VKGKASDSEAKCWGSRGCGPPLSMATKRQYAQVADGKRTRVEGGQPGLEGAVSAQCRWGGAARSKTQTCFPSTNSGLIRGDSKIQVSGHRQWGKYSQARHSAVKARKLDSPAALAAH